VRPPSRWEQHTSICDVQTPDGMSRLLHHLSVFLPDFRRRHLDQAVRKCVAQVRKGPTTCEIGMEKWSANAGDSPSSFYLSPQLKLTLDTLAMSKKIWALTILFSSLGAPIAAQNQDASTAQQKSNPVSKGIDYLFNYLNMAGTTRAQNFHPMSQKERTNLYFKTMVNPLGYVKAGFSAGIDQWNDKPVEWEQGASGYGKRYANIVGQYSIQRTVTFGLSSVFHEDNRYFNSGKKGVWPRTGYALASGILARHDNGSLHLSLSQSGGVAAGAFLSRYWQPPSQSSSGDGAVSFGITMASNMGFGVVKEFLPDLGRMIVDKRKKHLGPTP
jgi:hypothetical protein